MNKFEKHILEYIRACGMLRRGDTVLVAFSGGPDSVCLLSVLFSLKKVLGIGLSALHVHHGLRGAEADRDEAFCRELAQKMGVPFESVHVDVPRLVREKGLSEEEAARILRYEALEKTLERRTDKKDPEGETGRGWIAVAHHADDQAETILLNLLRGSGLKGMTGMRPVRGHIIRPQLESGRQEILKYLSEKQLAFCVDHTNLENDHTRNYLRNEILPRLTEEINKKSAEHIAAAGQMIFEADAFLEESAAKVFAETGSLDRENGRVALKRRTLKEKPQILRRYVIIEGLKQLGVPLKDWGEIHYAGLDEALFLPARTHLDLPGGVYSENTRETLCIYTAENAAGKTGSGMITTGGDTK